MLYALTNCFKILLVLLVNTNYKVLKKKLRHGVLQSIYFMKIFITLFVYTKESWKFYFIKLYPQKIINIKLKLWKWIIQKKNYFVIHVILVVSRPAKIVQVFFKEKHFLLIIPDLDW